MPQQEIRYFSGAKFDKRLSVFDDDFKPGKLVFTWQLLDENGNRVASNDMPMDSTTKFVGRKQVTFDLPKVDKRSRYTLTMNLVKDGVQRAYEERLVEVWPALETVKAPGRVQNESRPVLVFDPK